MKRKPSNGLYMNKIYRGYCGDTAINELYEREDSEIKNAKQAYLDKFKDFTQGEEVNGYRFLRSYEHFNLWEKLSKDGKHQWYATFYKNETPATYNRERYKEGDLAIENLSHEEHHFL